MRTIWSAIFGGAAFVIASNAAYTLDEDSKLYKSLGAMSEAGLRAIDIAKPEFLKQSRSSEPYTVDVVETDHLFEVSFCSDRQRQTVVFMQDDKSIGKWLRCPGSFTVEIDKTTLKILGTHYNRD